MEENLRNVKYSAADAARFEKIALKLGRPKRVVFSQMLDYFYRSKKDPTDLNDELLKNTILKAQKELIGFIKTQESQLLIPAKNNAELMMQMMNEINAAFHLQVTEQNNRISNSLHDQGGRLAWVEKALKIMAQKTQDKELLKQKFLGIMNHYMKVRDGFGVMTSAKEKQELKHYIHQQINSL